jgi:TfoX/Sxy family transcriptional regulator of competence genes
MAYDEELAERIRELIGARARVTEQKMFGGIGFMINGNMGCGVMKDELLVRVDPDEFGKLVKEPGARPLEMMKGKPSAGFLLIAPAGLAGKKLEKWVVRGVDFAGAMPPKASKKKKPVAKSSAKSKK